MVLTRRTKVIEKRVPVGWSRVGRGRAAPQLKNNAPWNLRDPDLPTSCDERQALFTPTNLGADVGRHRGIRRCALRDGKEISLCACLTRDSRPLVARTCDSCRTGACARVLKSQTRRSSRDPALVAVLETLFSRKRCFVCSSRGGARCEASRV